MLAVCLFVCLLCGWDLILGGALCLVLSGPHRGGHACPANVERAFSLSAFVRLCYFSPLVVCVSPVRGRVRDPFLPLAGWLLMSVYARRLGSNSALSRAHRGAGLCPPPPRLVGVRKRAFTQGGGIAPSRLRCVGGWLEPVALVVITAPRYPFLWGRCESAACASPKGGSCGRLAGQTSRGRGVVGAEVGGRRSAGGGLACVPPRNGVGLCQQRIAPGLSNHNNTTNNTNNKTLLRFICLLVCLLMRNRVGPRLVSPRPSLPCSLSPV